jgi:protein-tyrosine sulfotransferase
MKIPMLSRHPLRDPAGKIPLPFLICSAGRSGSTLLRMILGQHPDVYVPPELNNLEVVIQKYRKYYRFLPWSQCVQYTLSEFVRSVSFEYWHLPLAPIYQKAILLKGEDRSLEAILDLLYREMMANHKSSAVWWGEKSINNAISMETIAPLYPAARYIHLIRDGRDVVASYQAYGLISKDFQKNCFYWMDSIRNFRKAAARTPLPYVLEIRYETLVIEPYCTLRKVFDFLDLDFDPAWLDFRKMKSFHPDLDDRDMHQNLKKPITQERIGTWKQRLSPQQQRHIQEYIGPFLREFGYSDDPTDESG